MSDPTDGKNVFTTDMVKKTEDQRSGSAALPVIKGLDRLPPFSARVVNAGFITGLALAALCLILSGGYLVYFHQSANAAVKTILERSQSSTAQPPAQSSAPSAQEYQTTRLALSVHMYIARISLLSTGVFVGLAFGFLGFSLFLIGINGSMDASLETAGNIKLQAARIAPGVFVLLASTILIGVCVTRSLPMTLGDRGSVNATDSAPPNTSEEDDALSDVDPRMPGGTSEPTQTPAPTVTPSVNPSPNDRSKG